MNEMVEAKNGADVAEVGVVKLKLRITRTYSVTETGDMIVDVTPAIAARIKAGGDKEIENWVHYTLAPAVPPHKWEQTGKVHGAMRHYDKVSYEVKP